MDFISISDYVKKYKIDKTKLSERSELFKQLYPYYERSYKKNTWTNYITWLKRNKIKHSSKSLEDFKKSKYFHKKIDEKSLATYWLCWADKETLYYLQSIAKDMENRNQNFNRWLFWAIKPQNR
ncbi:MAG TPA: hypothetical protein DCS12_08600, partial [Clostridiales bacterium]|nr:hypothetical protein [Clostridiales bacterium]